MKKMIKGMIPIVLALVLNVPVVNADDDIGILHEKSSREIKISIDEVDQTYPVPPMIVNDRTFVPMRSVFEALGTTVEWIEETKTAKVSKGNITIEVPLNSYFAKKNGVVIKLDAKPFIQEGRTMVPLRFISESFGAEVCWNESDRSIVINTFQNELNNDEDEHQENQGANLLTYEEAVQKALKHSYKLKNQIEEIEKLKISRSEAGDALGGSYPTGYGNGTDDAAQLSKLKKVKSLDTSLQMARRQVEDMKESIGFEVKNAMNEISQRLDEKELMNLELQNAKTKLEMARAKERKGLLSKYDLEKEEDAYHKQIKEKEMLEKTIETAYTKLNSLIGFNEGEVYSLEYTTQYEPLEDEDLDHLVIKVINESPTIWNQEKKIEMAELDLSLYVFNAGGDSYEIKQIDLRQEKYNLANLKLSLEESTKTMYQQLQQLEKSYELLEENLKSAERRLKLIRAQYNLEMATDMQLLEAELAVEQTKYEIKKKAIEHEKSKELLYKPYLTAK